MRTSSFATFAVVVGVLSLASACAGEVSLDDRPCPCAEGWSCCASRNMCVAPGATCGDGLGGLGQIGTSAGDGGLGGLQATKNPVELATAQSARCFATDREHVYWQNADGLVVGSVKGAPRLEVSSTKTPLASNALCGIAIDGDELITTAYQLGKLVSLSLASNGEWHVGGNMSLFGDGLKTPSSLSLAAETIYVTDHEGGKVVAVARGRGQTVVLAEGLTRPHGVVHDNAFVYFVEQGDSTLGTGAIKKVAKDGGAVAVVAGNQKSPDGLVMWDGRLYWKANRRVWSVAVSGADVKELASELTLLGSGGVGVDGQSVFFGASRGMMRVALAGGAASEIYSGTPHALTVDEGRVFWADGSSVWSATK